MKKFEVQTLKGNPVGRQCLLDDGTGFVWVNGEQYKLVPKGEGSTWTLNGHLNASDFTEVRKAGEPSLHGSLGEK